MLTINRNTILLVLVAVTVLVLDQLSKLAVVNAVGMGGVLYPIPMLGEWLRIVAGINTGTACGYFPQLSFVFTLAPFAIVPVVLWFYRSQQNPSLLFSVGVGLIVGGALGNLVDRLRLGYVVDFIQIGTFPVFNVADASVSTAVVLMLLWSLREDVARSAATEATVEGGSGETTLVAKASNDSWKIGLSFLAIFGIIVALGFVLCVYVPANFLR